MMPKDILRDAALFVDGRGYAGNVSEMVLPKVTPMFREHLAGGMGAAVDIPMGKVEKMETEFTLTGFDYDVLRSLKLVPGNTIPITVRGSAVDSGDGTSVPVVANIKGYIKEADPGTWKPGEDMSLKVSMTVYYYKLEHNGNVVYEIDPVNYVMIIDGTDQAADIRTALGL